MPEMNDELTGAEKYNSDFWQEGICGNANVVTYNGEDVRPVCYIEFPVLRATVIAQHNAVVRRLIASQQRN